MPWGRICARVSSMTTWRALAVCLVGCAVQGDPVVARWCGAAVECRDVLEVPGLTSGACDVWSAVRGPDDVARAVADCDAVDHADQCLWAECVMLTLGGWQSVERDGGM